MSRRNKKPRKKPPMLPAYQSMYLAAMMRRWPFSYGPELMRLNLGIPEMKETK